jgi:hypothetical protein
MVDKGTLLAHGAHEWGHLNFEEYLRSDDEGELPG